MGNSSDKGLTRREILTRAVELSAAGVVVSLSFGLVTARDVKAHWVPRPPGAIDGKAFTAACSHCGQCVTACPYDTLKLAAPSDPAPNGTPYFEPRDVPCYMCHDIPCVKACPTGALDPLLTEIEKARMGVALIDPASCLSFQGLRCEICYRECPITEKAIVIEAQPRAQSKHTLFLPVIKPEHCTGCGVCVKSCPTDKAAIQVADREAVLGEIGRHYRLGWLAPDDAKNQHDAPTSSTSGPDKQKAGGLDTLNAIRYD